MTAPAEPRAHVRMPRCELPLERRVDLVVAGGTLPAVSLALAAAGEGASVLLAAPHLYLGEDRCATLRLWREEEERTGPLTEDLLDVAAPAPPLEVKQGLAQRLLDAGVEVILGARPVGVLADEENNLAGVVLATRNGRQAIAAAEVVDGTRHALLHRHLGIATVFPGRKEIPVSRIVIGGTETGDDSPVRRVRGPADANGEPTDWYEYDLDLTLAEDSPAGWSALEAEARDRSARAGALRAAASLGYELPAPYERAPRLYALGWRTPEADAVEMGIEIGRDVAGTPPKGSLRVIAAPPTGEISGVLVPSAVGFRPGPGCGERAASAEDSMPVLHEVDVLVVGGGTAGAAAGIAAARAGAKTLVIEPQEALGGLGTVGLITKPWYGLSVGFAAETPFDPGPGGAERKAEWLRGELSGAGGEVWFGSFAFAALLEENTVIGAAVSTPWGHGAVLAGVVVDATGNADLAAAAGCETLDGANRDDVAVQGAGLALRLPGADYSNSDFLLVDESDVVDVSRAALGAVLTREPAEAFDVVPLVQSRERRRIRGAHVMRYLDQILGRTYPDTVVVSHSDYDSHGYPSDLYFALLPHDEQTRRKNHPAPHPSRPIETPYRCLLPQGVENLLVAGLGISMHRDAAALVRMQPDILNQGYAAGLAAVRAVRDDVFVRDIDVAALQRDLAEAGNLPDEVLDAADSFPLSEERIRESVRVWRDPDASYEDRSLAMAAIFTRPGVAIPLLRDGLGGASGEEAVELAKLLGVLGQDDGADVLAEALDATAFDPKILQGRMAEYAHLPTPVDALILALGYGGADGALPSILRKLEALDAGVHLSHHRAVALALEALGAPQAAAPLAGLLQKPGMSGHEMLRPEPLHDEPGKRRREGALREVVLARALLRCGDDDGLGRAILERYRHDLRGHLARHAALVLDMDAREG